LDKKYILSKILQMKTLTKKEKMMKKMLMTIAVLVMISSLLMAQGYSGGDGSEGNPYQIANEADLIYLSQHSDNWDNHFKQTASISFNADESQVDWDGDGSLEHPGDDAVGWSPIGNSTTNFTGDYNGQNFTIKNLYINRTATEYVGLFGYINGSAIQNIGLTDVSVSGNAHTGGLLGYSSNSSTITNCFSTGTVSGSGDYVGGLIGESTSSTMNNSYSTSTVTGVEKIGGFVGESTSSTIEKSYSTGSVSGENMMGGFVGFNDGSSSLSNCYSLGNVTRSSGTGGANGGFIGQLYAGTITNCYSTGSVSYSGETTEGFAGYYSGGSFSNCFWDTETSGSASSSGQGDELIGKTTTEMKTLATFTGASWDIVSAYDTGHIWNMDSGVNSGYPYLSWAKTVDQSLPVTLASFSGRATKAGVVLEWETSAEIENAGFIIRRQVAGDRNLENGETDTSPISSGLSDRDMEDFNHQSTINNQQFIASYLDHQSLVGAGSVTKSTHYTFTDSKVEAGKTYVYTLSDVDFSGKETVLAEAKVQVKVKGAIIADNYQLMPVYPNPFNASFTVPFSLNEAMNVKIALYNIAGQQVMTILQSELNAGDYAYQVNAEDLSSGVYFVNVELSGTSAPLSDRKTHTQKIVLMK
jgi:hypothetical protein